MLAGLVLLAAGVTALLDATGALTVRDAVLLPVVLFGLSLAGVVGVLTYAVRRHFSRRPHRGPRPG
ncbi:hypothetical protein HCK00_09265 [Streptomyces sp. PLAI1-29]|uniref:Uncharacterized protein n=1 Tax=Streptomyces zingiberis TaxID=2053010 RepID=A0ABX1BSM1_9ACTN|nr:hypothetical protein [Streptomyces zingiberis]